MSNIRIGLIGYGGWTRLAFVPALRQHEQVHIVSAAAPSDVSQARIRGELGLNVTVFDDFEPLLEDPDLDAVMVAVPDPIHELVMDAVLERSVPVYYEPPLSDSPDGILKMIKKLVRTDQITHGDLEMGFATVIHRAAELVKQGAVGALRKVHLRLRSDWAQFGGPDLCLAHHLGPWYMDGLNSIIGKSPKRVLVMDGSGQAGRRQHHCLAHLDYGGFWGTLDLNINSLDNLETTIELVGDDGDLTVDYFRSKIHLRTKSNPDSSGSEIQPAMPVVGGWPGEAESVAAFLSSVEKGSPNRTNGRMAAKLYLAGLAIEKSKSTGTWVTIEDLAVLDIQT